MRTAFPKFLLLMMCLTVGAHAYGNLPTDDEDWELAINQEGIKVYTRSVKDSHINAFRAETLLEAPLEAVMAVMSDPKSCLEWVHQCAEAYNLPGGTFNERYAYSINDMPWPVSDRDYVLKIKTMTGDSRHEIIMRMEAAEGRKDRRDDYVRMQEATTIYEFKRVSDRHTRIIWYQHAEPGGSIPSWLVNRLATDIPYKSLRELNRVVQQDRYQGYTIRYDEKGEIRNVMPPESKDEPSAAKKARTAGDNANAN